MAKEIVESVQDEDGEPVYARKWNNDVLDVPVVKKREHRRHKLAKQGVTAVIAYCQTPWERMLYILCPAGGMRIAEVLALDIDKHISSDPKCPRRRIRKWSWLRRKQLSEKRKVVRPERFELPTFWFVARRSIQLS
jgi:hypothetical protein